MLTYAVGDVHGCLHLLDDLFAKITEHAAGRSSRLVLIGDYIDRGPDSAGVVARLRALQADPAQDVVCLLGNHEDLLLKSLIRPAVLQVWIANGGDATLASYGVERPTDIPADDLEWIMSLPTSFEDGRRCFVHAGLNPDKSGWADQVDEDRLWIREAFLTSDCDFGRLVVHGHTPRTDGRPESRPNRVNVDTGAVYGGRLTAAVFDDASTPPIAFLQAR